MTKGDAIYENDEKIGEMTEDKVVDSDIDTKSSNDYPHIIEIQNDAELEEYEKCSIPAVLLMGTAWSQ